MSDTIKITIIHIDENGFRQEINVTHKSEMTLMSTLLKEQLISGSFCGGRGFCKRCRVQFLQAPPLPTKLERGSFTPDELRQGYRFACMARPKHDCAVCVDFAEYHKHFENSSKVDIVTDVIKMPTDTDASEEIDMPDQSAIPENPVMLKATDMSEVISMSEKNDLSGQHTSIHDKEANNFYSSFNRNNTTYMIAVDLGTTTIAMQLMDMKTGKVIDTYLSMNPQRSYGSDVLSRIQAANAGCAEILRDSVWSVLQTGVNSFSYPACCMCIAGNTTMEHLLMGLPTESLGRSPFTPVEIGLQRCTLQDGSMPVYLTPGISTFVGGDIVAGLYHCHLLNLLPMQYEQHSTMQDEMQQEPNHIIKDEMQNIKVRENARGRGRNADGAVLFIDLGTNGEMAITNGERTIVTATAAGPAFEGGAGASVVGSDMIALTASLLEQGIVDETGLLAESYFEEGITVSLQKTVKNTKKAKTSETEKPNQSVETAKSIHLTQQDIRSLQMAKAAVRAGVEVLYEKMGCPKLTQVCLAGGFGYYLNVDAAIAIGLLPETLRYCARSVGNTSLAGAFDMGRDLWTGRLKEETLMRKLHQIESINLAEQENFDKLYLGYLNFPI